MISKTSPDDGAGAPHRAGSFQHSSPLHPLSWRRFPRSSGGAAANDDELIEPIRVGDKQVSERVDLSPCVAGGQSKQNDAVVG